MKQILKTSFGAKRAAAVGEQFRFQYMSAAVIFGLLFVTGLTAFLAIPHSAKAQTEMSYIDISAEVSENGACGRAAKTPPFTPLY